MIFEQSPPGPNVVEQKPNLRTVFDGIGSVIATVNPALYAITWAIFVATVPVGLSHNKKTSHFCRGVLVGVLVNVFVGVGVLVFVGVGVFDGGIGHPKVGAPHSATNTKSFTLTVFTNDATQYGP